MSTQLVKGCCVKQCIYHKLETTYRRQNEHYEIDQKHVCMYACMCMLVCAHVCKTHTHEELHTHTVLGLKQCIVSCHMSAMMLNYHENSLSECFVNKLTNNEFVKCEWVHSIHSLYSNIIIMSFSTQVKPTLIALITSISNIPIGMTLAMQLLPYMAWCINRIF